MVKRSRGLVPLVLVELLFAFGASLALPPAGRADAPAGQLTWAVPVNLVPAWFDPADATGILTPFMILYALHDALVKPMPGKAMAPSLAESWSVAADGLTYEFVLRQGVRFPNGDVVTADEGLIQEQAAERDRKRREAILHRIQQLMHERAMFAPVWNIASLNAYGPRVAESGLGLIGNYLFSAPYEEVKLKGR